jgi:hypothetical protein
MLMLSTLVGFGPRAWCRETWRVSYRKRRFPKHRGHRQAPADYVLVEHERIGDSRMLAAALALVGMLGRFGPRVPKARRLLQAAHALLVGGR